MQNWTRFYLDWLTVAPVGRTSVGAAGDRPGAGDGVEPAQLLIVRYEELLQELRRPLVRLLRFLHRQPTAAMLDCAVRAPDGLFKRPPKLYPIDPFAIRLNGTSLRRLVEEQRKRVYRLLQQRLDAGEGSR